MMRQGGGGGAWTYFVLAGGGWLFTYLNQLKIDQRAAQLERVNAQLRDLYGPLLSCVTASKATFDAMLRQHAPGGTAAGISSAYAADPSSRAAEAYRSWVREV